MTVQFHVDWVNGTLDQTADTYTFATPDLPTSGTFANTGDATIDVTAASPWNGQSLFRCTHWYDGAFRTSLSGLPSSQIRGLIQMDLTDITASGEYTFLRVKREGFTGNGGVTVGTDTSGDLQFKIQIGATTQWVRWTGTNVMDLTNLNFEFISDPNNATESQRLRARYWSVGGSPGSFVDRTGGDGSYQGTADTKDTVVIADPNNNGHTGLYVGKIYVSDSITEDLSALLSGQSIIPKLNSYRRRWH